MTAATLPPAGWYSDPWHLTQWRWWDGTTWTGYTDFTYVGAYAPVGPGYAFPAPTIDESRPIRAGWTAILGIVVGVAASVLVFIVLRELGVAENSPLLTLGVQLGLWSGLIGACVIAVRRHGTGSLRDLGLKAKWIDLPLGLGYGVASLMGVGAIAAVLKSVDIVPKREGLIAPMDRDALAVIVIVLIAVVGAPLVEELFFRGLLMSGLVVRFGPALGIILQAVVFGLVHLGPTDARGNLGVFLLIAPVGAVLGVLRYCYKRLGTGMATHAVYNAIIVTLLLTVDAPS